MKADPFVQLRLLDLQALDLLLTQLAHRRRTLPELLEITRVDALVAALRDDVVRAETLVSDLARDTRKIEAEVEQVRSRRARDEQRMTSGEITNAKQLQDLGHEVGTLTRRQGALEDVELEIMERAETAQSEWDRLLGLRGGLLTERAAAEAARDAAYAEIEAETTRATAERTAMATTFPADLLGLYDKIRAAEGGIGAGAIGRGQCGACRLDLMRNEVAEIKAAAVDEVLRHEECRRIMVRTAESGL